MDTYEDRIKKVASEILDSVDNAPEEIVEDIVDKEARMLCEYLEKVAEEERNEEDARLSDKALETLGLDTIEKEDEEDEEEERDDEAEDEDVVDEKKAEEYIKVAQARLVQAFEIEKEAQQAFNEAQILKVAAARVLAKAGAIEVSDIEKIASMTYDKL